MKHLLKASPSIVLSVSIAVGLAACGNKEEKKVATQVAAKVGGEEISVHQINQALNNANTSNATPESIKGMGREVLEKLIDQQLAIGQSSEKKLDRTPEVMAQLDAARRDILARAYVQQLVSALPKPSAEEIKAYYKAHPELFAERRVFTIQELITPRQAGLAEQLGAMGRSGKSTDDMVAWLKAHDIKFNGSNATRPAEQIPMELLSKLQPLKDGQSLVLQAPQSITTIRIAASQTVPIDEAQATPRIQQFLGNQRANEAIAANMKALRKNTKIEYVGEFAQPEPTAAAAAATASQAAASSTAAASKPEDQAKATLEKGIAGLK